MNFNPHSFAFSWSWEARIMVPSSPMISQHRPQGFSPASRRRSTVASVWPARSSTPCSRASRGNIWPGRRKSSGRALSSAQARAVTARSWAEMPVVVDTWSMETVKAVSWLSVLWDTIWGNRSLWMNSRDMGMQMSPLPWVAMKLTCSVVTDWAAQIRSPSFSRSGSSVHRIMRPCRSSSRASSMVLY